jgi:helix-turn-helix protein
LSQDGADEPLSQSIPNRRRASMVLLRCDRGKMSARADNSLLALFLDSLARADDALKRELAAYLRPYLADSPGRLLDANEKARQLGLHPETLVKMARAGRCRGAIKVGREWRFPPESLEILPPALEGAPTDSALRPRLRPPPTGIPGSVAAIRGRR